MAIYLLEDAIAMVMQGRTSEAYAKDGLYVGPNRFNPRVGGYTVSSSWIIVDRAADLERAVLALERVKAYIGNNAQWQVVLHVGGLFPPTRDKELNSFEAEFRSRQEVGEWKGSHRGRKAFAAAKSFGWGVDIRPRR